MTLAACDEAEPVSIAPLTRTGLPVDTTELARFLVGKYLIRDDEPARLVGRIVETEAYPLGDSTSHAFMGRRAYNGSMFLAPGHAYMRFTYGSAWMLNVSSEPEGIGAGVLIRALEPCEGIALMEARRPGVALRDLARGPGRLCRAFGLDAAWDGADLCSGHGLWFGQRAELERALGVTTRIGLTREMHRPLRFYEAGSRFVSGPRRLLG